MSVVSTEVRRLYRSRTDRILGGVCGGLGEYLGVDSNLIRIVWVLLSFVYGAAILIYLIAWILLPEKPEVYVKPQTALPKPANWTLIVGLILIGLGALMFLKTLIPIRFLSIGEGLVFLLAGAILVLAGLRYGTRSRGQS